MFSKTADPTTAPNQPAPTSDSRSTLAAGLKIIGDLVTRLRQVEGCMLARMSGSGATCFGLFAENPAPHTTALRLAHPDWRQFTYACYSCED